MNVLTCKDARDAIEARRFVGWGGLPTGCTPAELFGIPEDAAWGLRRVGHPVKRLKQYGVRFSGYSRALANMRDGVVVMFDGHLPELDGGWSRLQQDLGAPEAKLIDIHGAGDDHADRHHLVIGRYVDQVEAIRENAHGNHTEEGVENAAASAAQSGAADHRGGD